MYTVDLNLQVLDWPLESGLELLLLLKCHISQH